MLCGAVTVIHTNIAGSLVDGLTAGRRLSIQSLRHLLQSVGIIKLEESDGNPDGLRILICIRGLGVRNSAITTVFKQGPLLASESETAFAIDGKGFSY